ncbi:MAG: hypothetical protein ABI456_16480 [Ktedonobacteraceae bacterium]
MALRACAPSCGCSVFGPAPTCVEGSYWFGAFKMARLLGNFDLFWQGYDAYLMHLGWLTFDDYNARHSMKVGV